MHEYEDKVNKHKTLFNNLSIKNNKLKNEIKEKNIIIINYKNEINKYIA